MKRQQLVKVIITMMTLMCSTLSWGQEEDDEYLWFNRYLLLFYSDSIHETSRIDMNRVYSDTTICLSPNKHHYIQVTDKPVYLYIYDTQESTFNAMYAYDFYPDGSGNGFGTWVPSTSPLCSQYGAQDGWWSTYKSDLYDWDTHSYPTRRSYNVAQYAQPYQNQWWTLDNFYEENYRYFEMEPGLYYAKAFYTDEKGFDSFIIQMAKLGNLSKLSSSAYPRITSEIQKKKETVNVTSMYTYYTVTGSTRYVWTNNGEYLFNDDCKIADGEYQGYYCRVLGSGARYYIYPPASLRSGHYKIDSNPAMDTWYKLTPSEASGDYFTAPAGQVYVIWDVNGERVKFISEETYEKEILQHMSATSISTPTITPYAPDTYFNLQGVAVENPIPGQIYIHNGKKILYKK